MDPATISSPLDQLRWPRSTARLTLRRGVQADAAAVLAYRGRDDVARWLGQLQADPRAWAERWSERLATTVILEYLGTVIGDVRIVPGIAHAQGEVMLEAIGTEAEIMWALAPASQGQGLGREAVTELIAIAFSELGLRRLTACCFADNVPSWRLMERVGMRREGCAVRSALHRDGTWHDFLYYGLLAPGA